MLNGGTRNLELVINGDGENDIVFGETCTWSTDSNLINITGNNRTATVQAKYGGTGTFTVNAECDGTIATCTIIISAGDTVASEWWYNKGLISQNIGYNSSFKGSNDDEIIISSSGGFTKYTILDTNYLSVLNKESLDDEELAFYWENLLVNAGNDWFYWVNMSDLTLYLTQFSTNHIDLYKLKEGEEIADIAIVATNATYIESYIANHTPTETFTLQTQ